MIPFFKVLFFLTARRPLLILTPERDSALAVYHWERSRALQAEETYELAH